MKRVQQFAELIGCSEKIMASALRRGNFCLFNKRNRILLTIPSPILIVQKFNLAAKFTIILNTTDPQNAF